MKIYKQPKNISLDDPIDTFPPGSYARLEDVEELVEAAWKERSALTDKYLMCYPHRRLFEYSETAAHLRVMKGK